MGGVIAEQQLTRARSMSISGSELRGGGADACRPACDDDDLVLERLSVKMRLGVDQRIDTEM